MEGRIEYGEQTILAGISFFGDPFSESGGWTEENEIGRLWKRFMTLSGTYRESMPPLDDVQSMYEIHAWDAQTAETGHYEVFVGYPVVDVLGIPITMLAKVLPASRFAVFTLEGEAIHDQDNYVQMDVWIEEHGCQRGASWMYNLYDDRYKGIDRMSESIIDVYLPIKP